MSNNSLNYAFLIAQSKQNGFQHMNDKDLINSFSPLSSPLSNIKVTSLKTIKANFAAPTAANFLITQLKNLEFKRNLPVS